MKAHLEFDLADEKDYNLWSRIVQALQGAPITPTPTAEAVTRPKLTPQPQPVATPQPTAAPVAAAPAPQPAPAPAPAPQPAPSISATNGGAPAPSIQELRECLAGLGAVSSAGEAADFLRQSIGSPNLSSIPEDKRAWAKALLVQETANRQASAAMA